MTYGPPTPIANRLGEEPDGLLIDAMVALNAESLAECEDLACNGLVRALFANGPHLVALSFLVLGIAAQRRGESAERREMLEWTITLADRAGLRDLRARAVASLPDTPSALTKA